MVLPKNPQPPLKRMDSKGRSILILETAGLARTIFWIIPGESIEPFRKNVCCIPIMIVDS